jgi:predicted nucleic acid-binding protein
MVWSARCLDAFATSGSEGWATCPITESGFVRMSSNPIALPSAIGVGAAHKGAFGIVCVAWPLLLHRRCLDERRRLPAIAGYRQATDVRPLTHARRYRVCLVTFDALILAIADESDVEALTTI